MSFQERSSDNVKENLQQTGSFTGLVHYFRNPIEYIQVKSTELGSKVNILAEAFRNRFEITERCFNRLCGAPPSAHKLALA